MAVLADEAASLIPSAVQVRIAPAAADDPYRWGARSWTVYFGVGQGRDDTVATHVSGDDSPVSALARLVEGLGELSETRRFWGVAFPVCAGHRHPARVDPTRYEVLLRCPQTGEVVGRVGP